MPGEPNGKSLTTGAISKARIRLGAEPLKELFFRICVPIATPGTCGAWYHDRRVMAIDGVILDAPDTDENVERFERKEHKNGESAFPQVRVVGLIECGNTRHGSGGSGLLASLRTRAC